jgi:hypothetical protein
MTLLDLYYFRSFWNIILSKLKNSKENLLLILLSTEDAIHTSGGVKRFKIWSKLYKQITNTYDTQNKYY